MPIGLSTLAGTASLFGWSLIPLFAIGFTVFRYQNADPETHPPNAQEVI